MILWTLFSFLLTVLLAVIYSPTTGLWPYGLLQSISFLILGSVILLSCIFGFIKNARFLFFKKKRFEKCTLSELKKSELCIDFFIKSILFLSLFMSSVASIPFFYAWINGLQDNIVINFSTVIESPFYAAMFIMVLLPLKSRIKNRQIDFMFDSMSITGMTSDVMAVNKIDDKKINNMKNGKLATTLKIVFMILWIVVSIFVLIRVFTRLDEKIGIPIDIPSFLVIFLSVIIALFTGGQFKNFGNAIASSFTGKKVSIVQNEKNIEALTFVMQTIITSGIFATLMGFYAMFKNLEDRNSFAPCFYVAMIPVLYATFLTIVLECMVASLKRKNQ